MSFKYDKDNLFKEFDVAKQKDIALSKLDTLEEKENDIYKNRIQFLKEHIELKKTNPSYYSDLDINFDNLLSSYLTTNPRETFYQKVFGKSFAEVRAPSIPQSVND
tara:strand:- start:1082 stop:1399 length:318 start_codon:yes stop_codon:yes gene_type:complete